MQRVLVATDFSTRSDRAVRRASMLAKQFAATLVLMHVVDDDRPQRLVAAERREAAALLAEIASTIGKMEGLTCQTRILLGEPFEEILRAANDVSADLIVMGPHRRQILRDVFVGTTAERTIRVSQRPVLMTNAVPSRFYRRTMIATDFSTCSRDAVRAAQALGLLNATAVVAMNAYGAPALSLMSKASMTMEQVKDHFAEEEARAGHELTAFLDKMGLRPSIRISALIKTSESDAIRDCAREKDVDLIVVGTHGRTGIEKLLLGSVAESLLRASDRDVLVVPPAQVT